ncbi:hypothetical protein V6N13_043414 [Hibiscus sabdariffa]
MDVSSAELLAIKEALSLFISSPWLDKGRFIIESDCKLAVEWLLNPSVAPLAFKPIIDSCLQFTVDLSWSIVVVPRECNSLADKLTKQGISRLVDFVDTSERLDMCQFCLVDGANGGSCDRAWASAFTPYKV